MKRILGLIMVLAVVGLGINAVANPFGAGNIVLVRVGDGTQSISNLGNSVFLDEYTTDAIWAVAGSFSAPTPVQSIAMPTNWVGRQAPLIIEGSARTDGALSLSTDGRFLLLAGFGAAPGQVTNQAIDLTTTTGVVNQVARVIGLVDGNGHVYTTTTLIDANEDGNDVQSAVSLEGTNIWHVGEGNATGGKYTTVGSMTSTQVETVSRFNSRVFNIYNKTLYYSANHVVGAPTNTSAAANPFGGALPTSFVNSNFLNLAGVLGNSITSSPAIGSPFGFALFNVGGGTNPDTLYVADNTTNAPGEPFGKAGGVLKYCYIPASNAWVNFGYIYAEGATSVTGQKNGSTITLYITEGGGTLAVNQLYPYNDVSGFAGKPQTNPDGGDANVNAEPLGPPGVNANLINTRGVAFAPQGGDVGTITGGAGVISVGPPFGPYLTGPEGGPFPISNNVFNVANLGSQPANFAVSLVSFSGGSGTWSTATPSSGTLGPSGGVTTVTLTPNGIASALPGGFTYTGHVVIKSGNPGGTTNTQVFTTLATLVDFAFFISPTSNSLAVGEAGGPFAPSSFVYTLTNATANPKNWSAGTSASWDSLSATSGTLAPGATTNITVSITANANTLALGTYQDTLLFSNVSANAALPTRTITLQVGFGFFDDFSTYATGDIVGQNNWYNPTPGLNDNPYLISGGVLALDGGQHPGCADGIAMEEEPAKDISFTPVTNATAFAYLGMTMVVTSAPPAPNTWDFTLLPTVPGANVTINEARTSVNDNGSGHYVWNTHVNGFDSFYHGTTPRSYNTPYNVIIVGDTVNSNCWVFINPADGNTSHLFAMAYDAHDGPDVSGITSYEGPGSSGIGSLDIDNFCSGNDQPGILISRMAFSTNYTAVYNWLVNTNPPPADPFVTWQNQYFTSGELTNPAFSGPGADPFGKGMSNTNQFLAGFNPTNASAYVHITAISKTNSGTDVRVDYLGANGDSSRTPPLSSRTNVLEFTSGTVNGSYSSNNFTSTGQTNILSGGIGLGTLSNMLDPGGATNVPSRYYRVRVVVP